MNERAGVLWFTDEEKECRIDEDSMSSRLRDASAVVLESSWSLVAATEGGFPDLDSQLLP